MWLKTIFKVLENNTVIQIELISMTKQVSLCAGNNSDNKIFKLLETNTTYLITHLRSYIYYNSSLASTAYLKFGYF